MAYRESFYVKPEARFYKETSKPGKNTKEFKSQINPLNHSQENAYGGKQMRHLKHHHSTTINIFGESTNTAASWLSTGAKRQGQDLKN